MICPALCGRTRSTRRRSAETYIGVAYRGLFYALVATPVWGTVLALAIVWDRAHP